MENQNSYDNDDFLIDVAKNRRYQNQSDEYCEKYREWRTDPKNPFGYKFVHDTREHAYVDGEGFVVKDPAAAEQKALGRCCGLLAAAMISMMLVDVLKYIFLGVFFENASLIRMYYSQRYEAESFAAELVYFTAVFNVLKYLVPIVLLALFSRLPFKVALPKSKGNGRITAAAVVVMLLLLVVGVTGNYIFSQVLLNFGIDTVYYDYLTADSMPATIVYFVMQAVIVPILLEVLFRGYLLQMLRQFGDFFAVLTVSVVNALCGYDLSLAPYVFFSAIFVGFFTIRSGSIVCPICMRIAARSTFFIVSFMTASMIGTQGKIFQCIVSMIICIGFMLAYFKDGYTFRRKLVMGGEDSRMTVKQKLAAMAVCVPFLVWLIASVVFSAVTLRFV